MRKLIHVEFPGHGTFWVMPEVFEPDGGDSPLIPEAHVRDGQLVSLDGGAAYAHVWAHPNAGCIMRHGAAIGHPSQLRRLDGGDR